MSARLLILILLICAAVAGGLAIVELGSAVPTGAAAAADAVLDPVMRYAEVPSVASSTATEPKEAAVNEDRTVNVPILVYHVVRPSYPTDSQSVRSLAVTPEAFGSEMLHLEAAGYHVIPFSSLEQYLASSTPLPAKPIILTFDDGWRDQYTYAFPILEKYGYTATFFVFTNAINRPDFFTLDDLKAMVAAGMTVGDHSRSHPYLTRITSEETLWSEIAGSKALLEHELGVPIREFAYPFGQANATTTALVKAAGYVSARGDYYTGAQSTAKLYRLSALNAPTTTELFTRRFP